MCIYIYIICIYIYIYICIYGCVLVDTEGPPDKWSMAGVAGPARQVDLTPTNA